MTEGETRIIVYLSFGVMILSLVVGVLSYLVLDKFG